MWVCDSAAPGRRRQHMKKGTERLPVSLGGYIMIGITRRTPDLVDKGHVVFCDGQSLTPHYPGVECATRKGPMAISRVV